MTCRTVKSHSHCWSSVSRSSNIWREGAKLTWLTSMQRFLMLS